MPSTDCSGNRACSVYVSPLNPCSNARLSFDDRQDIAAWLDRHGIKASNCSEIVYGEGVITARMYLEDASGKYYLDDNGGIAHAWVTVPSTEPMPRHLLNNWLAKAKECPRG